MKTRYSVGWASCSDRFGGTDGRRIKNEYIFYAGYVILQFIVLATAWNILGGYAGYVNFGVTAFFGLRLRQRSADPVDCGAVTGANARRCGGERIRLALEFYLRLRGLYFSIAT